HRRIQIPAGGGAEEISRRPIWQLLALWRGGSRLYLQSLFPERRFPEAAEGRFRSRDEGISRRAEVAGAGDGDRVRPPPRPAGGGKRRVRADQDRLRARQRDGGGFGTGVQRI